MPLRTRINGFTLIELIVFVVVAALFIPTAYIAFMAVARRAAQPEALVRARFLAETKVEDLTGVSYSAIPVPPSGYSDVRNDSRFSDANMPSPNPYAGFQWKWTYSNVAYLDNPSVGNTSLVAIDSIPVWSPTSSYRLGDYVRSPDTGNHCFYRVFLFKYSTWQPGRAYGYGEFVVPVATNGRSYICVLRGVSGDTEPIWPPLGTGQQVDDGTTRWAENTLFKVWQRETMYNVGDLVVPRTSSNGQTYRCTCANGASSCQSGSTDPDWTSTDNEINWVQHTMVNGSSQPLFSQATLPAYGAPCLSATRGSITWRESTVYKYITVYVLEPKGYEYIVNTVVTARPGAYP